MKLKEKIEIYFNYIFCGMQRKYYQEWDELLNEILDSGVTPVIGDHVITYEFNGNEYSVWIANFPYAYGFLYRKNGAYIHSDFEIRPSLRTIERLHEITSEQIKAHKKEMIRDFYRGKTC
ncbi:MAG: hypothetical protein ACK5NC_11270 [Vibrio sp.]